MKFTNDELKVEFEIPDVITVRQQMEFDSQWLKRDISTLESLWAEAKKVITKWECDIPLDVDIDTATDRRVAKIAEWVGRTVFSVMFSLENTPKNS